MVRHILNQNQKLLFGIYLPLTAVFLVFDHLFPGADFVNYLKFTAIITLFLFVSGVKKYFPEQKTLVKSLFFICVGDFFLVFCYTLLNQAATVLPFGIIGFAAAYLILIKAFQKNFRIGLYEVLAAVPVAGLTAPVFAAVFPYISGPLKYGLILFCLILCYTTWTCLCTVSRNYFNQASSYRIALAGILILICDLGVSLAIFHPHFNQQFNPWLKNVIWGAYIPAWTMIAFTIADPQLVKKITL